MEAKKAALILMKNSHFDGTPRISPVNRYQPEFDLKPVFSEIVLYWHTFMFHEKLARFLIAISNQYLYYGKLQK